MIMGLVSIGASLSFFRKYYSTAIFKILFCADIKNMYELLVIRVTDEENVSDSEQFYYSFWENTQSNISH